MTRNEAGEIELCGALIEVAAVSYRSPLRLQLSPEDGSRARLRQGLEGLGWSRGSPAEVELRGLEDELRASLGRRVRLRGVCRVVQGGSAPAGSEAASRFVDGQMPALVWFEVNSLRAES